MSQPPNYTPTTDFSQQEAINASGRSTVNTAALDTEFANIETTVDDICENLALIQRDDGKLKDLTVMLHTLSPEVLNLMGGFNLRGLWMADTAYAVNDIASNDEYTYCCVTAHTSGVSFDGQYWIQFGFTGGADAAQAAANAQVSANSAANSASSASTSATNASNSASAASTSATNAKSSAATATTKAGAASASATNAALSAASAAASAASVDTLNLIAEPEGSSLLGFINTGTGAIARTVQDKLRETISVKDFGAKGDGVTNDTAAIQAASNAASGKTLVFPPGTYKVVNGFDVSGDNTTIIGYSATLSYQQTTATYYHCIRLLGNNCRIDGLRIASPTGLVRDNTGYGISVGSAVTATENVVIENCIIDAVASAGIWVTNVANVIITGCHIVNCLADGIHFADGCYGITVDSNVLHANGDDNIAIVNDIVGSPFVGRFVVSNNDIEGGTAVSGHGVAIIGASGGVVIGNVISNTRAAAIGTYQWTDTSEKTSGLVITGNRIISCGMGGMTFGGCGISLQQSANVVISNNYITNLTYDAAKVCGGINATSSARLVVSGNTLDDNACDQLVITGATEALISGNTFGYGAREGVVISGSVSLVVVKDNTFTGTAGTNDINISLPAGTVRCYNNSLIKSAAITASVSTVARNEVENFTPTVTAESGSLTSASAMLLYQRAGRFLFVYLSISVTTNGTGAGSLNVTLPFAAHGVLNGRENSINGSQVNGAAKGTALVKVHKYDNSYPAANGSSFILSGVLVL